MALNPNYMIGPSIQDYLVDKDTGLPLRSGYILFFSDLSRTTPKNVFVLSGSPPDYSYTPIGNRVDLSSVGTTQYLGADVRIYYFPFDDDGNVELYFAQVFSSTNILQETRQGWPDFSASGASVGGIGEFNFVLNGQFLSHTNIPATDTPTVAGQITGPSTQLAPPGWTFERPSGSTAIDVVTFIRFGSYINPTPPVANPRYAIQINCQSPALGDSFKDLRLKFKDVNTFATDAQGFTFGFTAQNNNVGITPVTFYVIKYYGVGGSPTTETSIHTFNVQNGFANYSTNVAFMDNFDTTVGLANDDYIQLALRFPINSGFNIELTDFFLFEGFISNPAFPYTTTEQVEYSAQAGGLPVPDYNGNDLYLPIILTKNGFDYDRSVTGKVFATSYEVAQPGEILCDGAQYETSSYTVQGIPYSRLQKVFFNTNYNVPRWGTGSGFMTAIIFSGDNPVEVIITNNSSGATTAAGVGTAPFTVNTIHIGNSYGQEAYITENSGTDFNRFNLVNLATGGTPGPAVDGTTGFSFSEIQNSTELPLLSEITSILTVAAGSLTSTYWRFQTWDGSIQTDYYVWYTVNGTGSDPSGSNPGRIGIQINLLSTDSAIGVAEKTREALNGWQNTSVIVAAASSINSGDYFTINSTGNQYYVWYKKDNSGTDPLVVGRLGIEVDILSADTDAQVATKTLIAINSRYFATPDLRGQFIRGWSNGSSIDGFIRFSLVPGIVTSEGIGTFQNDVNKQHLHTWIAQQSGSGSGKSATTATDDLTEQTAPSGDHEARPLNAALNYVIKL